MHHGSCLRAQTATRYNQQNTEHTKLIASNNILFCQYATASDRLREHLLQLLRRLGAVHLRRLLLILAHSLYYVKT